MPSVPAVPQNVPGLPRRYVLGQETWQSLRSRRCHWSKKYSCGDKANTTRYAEFLARLPPVPEASAYALPPGSRVLLYGMSYLQQMVLALLCRSVVEHANKTLAPAACPRTPEGDCFARFELAGGIRLDVVYNNRDLQLESSLRDRMPAFLAGYSVAVVMQPHPDCFLQFGNRAWGPEFNTTNGSRACWVDLSKQRVGARDRAKRALVRRVFNAAFGNRWIEVLPWFAPPTIPHDELAEAAPPGVFATRPLVKRFPCCMACGHGHCHAKLDAHQCTPGTPTLLAACLAQRLSALLRREEHRACDLERNASYWPQPGLRELVARLQHHALVSQQLPRAAPRTELASEHIVEQSRGLPRRALTIHRLNQSIRPGCTVGFC